MILKKELWGVFAWNRKNNCWDGPLDGELFGRKAANDVLDDYQHNRYHQQSSAAWKRKYGAHGQYVLFRETWQGPLVAVGETDPPWAEDEVQFPRLLAEICAAGLDDETMQVLCDSMNLTPDRINELLLRADKAWEAIKEDHLSKRG